MTENKCPQCGAVLASPEGQAGPPDRCPGCGCELVTSESPQEPAEAGSADTWRQFLAAARIALTLAAIAFAIAGGCIAWGYKDHLIPADPGVDLTSITLGNWPGAVILQLEAIVCLLLRPAAPLKGNEILRDRA